MSPSTEPFNEAKYKALMDGLECSEVMLSTTDETETFRLDSNYFAKQYMIDELFVKENPDLFTCFSALSLTVDASAFYPALESYYGKGTVPFIRVADVKNRIDYDGCTRIPRMPVEFATLKLCHKGDIVLTKGGSVGNAGLILEESYVTRDLIFINSSKLSRLDYVALYLYLCTDFSYRLMIRSSSMTAQPHLTITLIRNIPIFNFSIPLKNAVCKVYEESENLMGKAIALYSSAQSLLLSSLNYRPVAQADNHTAKSFSSSFGKSGRLDAEYYQPKYDELFQLLSALPTKRLKSVVHIVKSIEPGSEYYGDEGVPFIRVSDVSKERINMPSIRIPKTTVPSIENLYPKKDTILFSKDGSVGIAYKVEDDMEAVTSNALLHLTVKDATEVLPDYLTLLLNSDIVKLQAERDASGAIIQHWKPSDIERVVVPILPLKAQRQIAEKIAESFSLRRKSQQLLDLAKCAVEMAIEQGETAAMTWLQKQK